MTDFKVGDRVRAVDVPPGFPLTAGRKYEVLECTPCGLRVRNDNGYPETFLPTRFELVEPRKDTPKVGDTVRVVLEGKVSGSRFDGFGMSAGGKYIDNYIVPDHEHVKSIEIITPAKPSVKDLPVGSVVRVAFMGICEKVDGYWMLAGTTLHLSDERLDSEDWVQLVEKVDE